MAELRDGERILAAGTIVKVGGIPVELGSGVVAKTHPENWKLIDEYREQTQASRDRSQGATQFGATLGAVQ